jgi:anti-sigma regulatory factor (Ser/Thr protein kinase)
VSDAVVERVLEFGADLGELRTVGLWLNDACHAAGLAYEVAFGLDVAVHEAVENVVRYAWHDAGPHRVALRFRADGRGVEVEVSDDGRPFDPLAVTAPPEALSLEAVLIGGRGIPLMRRFTSGLRYRREGDRNRLTLVGRAGARART